MDDRRRSQGLSLTEAGRYNTLFARLSDALASNERHRKVDMRQFLRVRFPMALRIRTGAGELLAPCQDFGGGGCSITAPTLFHLGDDVWLDGALVLDEPFPLHGRSQVAWSRLPSQPDAPHGYGLRFVLESPPMRDQIDRLLYRVLDLFLSDGQKRRASLAL